MLLLEGFVWQGQSQACNCPQLLSMLSPTRFESKARHSAQWMLVGILARQA